MGLKKADFACLIRQLWKHSDPAVVARSHRQPVFLAKSERRWMEDSRCHRCRKESTGQQVGAVRDERTPDVVGWPSRKPDERVVPLEAAEAEGGALNGVPWMALVRSQGKQGQTEERGIVGRRSAMGFREIGKPVMLL